MNLQLHIYLFQLSQLLSCNRKEKRNIITCVAENMKEYLADHPGCSLRELNAYFGEPEELAERYYTEGGVTGKPFLVTTPVIRLILGTLCCLGILASIFFLFLFLLQQFVPVVPLVG